MRKLREVLRLRYDLKLKCHEIGRSCAIGVSSVHKYRKRAEAAGITWPLPEDWDEARLAAALSPGTKLPARDTPRPQPDFAYINGQFREHKHVTLKLLWEEHPQANPAGYHYSRFCYLWRRWRSKLDLVLREEHKPGEKMFVDWAGDTTPIHDPQSGEVRQASFTPC